MMYALRAMLLALPLIACAGHPPDTEAPVVDPGLIVNPQFEPSDASPHPARWAFRQHAGEPSYELATADGVLIIRRTGNEPWGLVSQKLDVTELAGKELRFSMELAGELDESYGPGLQPAGLVVSVLGRLPADMPMLGKRHLLTMAEDPGLPAGAHGWSRHELRFRVPEGRNLELVAGVQMTMGGELRARAPQLIVVEESASR